MIKLSGTSFAINSRTGKANFTVTNTGQGTLTWTTIGSDGWLSLSGATNGSAAAGEAKGIGVSLLSPPDGKSTATVTVKSNVGERIVTITANLDEAPLVTVWFTNASGSRLNRLCVNDRVYMLARAADPDGVGSVMGAVAWSDNIIPIHNMAKLSSDTWRLGTFDINQATQWISLSGPRIRAGTSGR